MAGFSLVPLGPFELVAVIGKGGMGEVWHAVHKAQQLPVAVKVVTRKFARNPWYLAAIRSEVRSVAALDHPNILRVFDQGLVTAQAAASSDRLVEGSPWLAMELVRGGSLSRWTGRMPWPVLSDILLRVLDALAHAHARGVIHRDLKPGNVLLGDTVKLMDFGLAGAFGETNDALPSKEKEVVGTPGYMAPEQVTGTWRDQGPWTDLYALGCLAWALATGTPPFGKGPPKLVMRAQCVIPPPPMAAITGLPEGFEAWCRRLLEKNPRERFRCASDAAWALVQLGEPMEEFASVDLIEQPVMPVYLTSENQRRLPTTTTRLVSTASFATDSLEISTMRVESGVPPRRGESPKTRRHVPPPLPEDWRPLEGVDRAPSQLVGAGLALFGLRAVPMVNREPERDGLYKALAEVVQGTSSRMVVLQGPRGYGKSRLASWIGERAHELGAAVSLKALHGPRSGPEDGLAGMVRRHLRCTGLGSDQTRERVTFALKQQGCDDREEAAAVVALIAPGDAGDPSRGGVSVRLGSIPERHLVVRRVLERACQERPVIVWLDDAQWGGDALDFAWSTLTDPDPLPVLFVATVRSEDLERSGSAQAWLEGLLALQEVTMQPVWALEEEHRAELVREILGLEGDLAARVETRTAGNPLFATQLVADWVSRGVLVTSTNGFRLQSGEAAEIPDDLHQVWSATLERLSEQLGSDSLAALETAAALGSPVDPEEWREACAQAGQAIHPDLLEALVEAQLAVLPEGHRAGSWCFLNGMFQESLERRSREAGRWSELHRACARMLRARRGAGRQERRGAHLLAANALEEALEPLLAGARERMHSGDTPLTRQHLQEWRETVSALGLSPSDPRMGEGRLLEAQFLRVQGLQDQAAVASEELVVDAQRHGWRALLGWALRERGQAHVLAGDPETGQACLEQAVTLARESRDRFLLANCTRELGALHLDQGSWVEATRCLVRARDAFVLAGDWTRLGVTHVGLSELSKRQGLLFEAAEELHTARRCFERSGFRYGVAECVNHLGDVARHQGELAWAELLYAESRDRFEVLGAPSGALPATNLGLVQLAMGRHAEARSILEGGLEQLHSQGRLHLAASVHACLLPCLAQGEDWEAFAHHMAQARELFDRTGAVEVDAARFAAQGGDDALLAGQHQLGQDAKALASHLRTRLGHSARHGEA